MTDEIQISAGDDLDSRFVDKHRRNTKSDLIEITEDKLENILLKHLAKLEMQKRWLLPFSILLSVSLTLASAKFQDALNLKADVWNAVFVVILIVSIVWLVLDIIRLIRCWSQTKLEHLLSLIKNAESEG